MVIRVVDSETGEVKFETAEPNFGKVEHYLRDELKMDNNQITMAFRNAHIFIPNHEEAG